MTQPHFSRTQLRRAVLYRRVREVFGGNGVLLDHPVTRYTNDAEAIYSFEGTREINSLIVSRALTGIAAFV